MYVYSCKSTQRRARTFFTRWRKGREREKERKREREREDRQIDVVARAVPRLLVFPDRPGTRVERTSPHGDRSLLHSSRVTWARDEAREGGG